MYTSFIITTLYQNEKANVEERERGGARRAGVAAYLLCQLLLSRLVAARFFVSLQDIQYYCGESYTAKDT